MNDRKLGQLAKLAFLSTVTAVYAHMTVKQLRRVNP